MTNFLRQYLPIVIVGAIIGTFAIVFVAAYIALQKRKEKEDDNERHMADSEIVKRLRVMPSLTGRASCWCSSLWCCPLSTIWCRR